MISMTSPFTTGTQSGSNNMYPSGFIEVNYREWLNSKYLSRCRIHAQYANRDTVLLDKEEYDYALRCEQSYKLRYQTMVYLDGTVPNYTTTQEPPKKEKPKVPEKASKHIRHQFLKKRLQERKNKL